MAYSQEIDLTAEHLACGVHPEYGYCPWQLAIMMAYPAATKVRANQGNLSIESVVSWNNDSISLGAGPSADPMPETMDAMGRWDRGLEVDPVPFMFNSDGFANLQPARALHLVWQRVPQGGWGLWGDTSGHIDWLYEIRLDGTLGRRVRRLMDSALLLTNQLVDANDEGQCWDIWAAVGKQVLIWNFG